MLENGSGPGTEEGARYEAGRRLKDLALADRPRERLHQYGAGALSNVELIAILLNTGVQGEHVVRVAERLLVDFGGLGGLFRASLATLVQQHGLGKAKAAHLQAALVLGQRLMALQPEEQPLVRGPEDIFNLMGVEMGVKDREELRVVLLNTRNRILRIETLYRGSVNMAQVRTAEVFRPAIEVDAVAMLLVHNHPSGDPSPSEADVGVTRQAVEAGKLLDIEVFDHIILVQGGFYSMKDHALGFA